MTFPTYMHVEYIGGIILKKTLLQYIHFEIFINREKKHKMQFIFRKIGIITYTVYAFTISI